jgi:hypothetical protein
LSCNQKVILPLNISLAIAVVKKAKNLCYFFLNHTFFY